MEKQQPKRTKETESQREKPELRMPWTDCGTKMDFNEKRIGLEDERLCW
jgi:hypothetical protein